MKQSFKDRPISDFTDYLNQYQLSISSSWLLALPGVDSNLTNAEFSEAAAANLCLPSPACRERVEDTVKGNRKVDIYGDNVQATCLPGDHR